MLWERMAEDFTLMSLVTTDDKQGGFTSSWGEAASFKAAAVQTSNAEGARHDRAELIREWQLTSPFELGYGDVVRRESDKTIMRVTTGAVETPDPASFSFYQVQAEEWRLTH